MRIFVRDESRNHINPAVEAPNVMQNAIRADIIRDRINPAVEAPNTIQSAIRADVVRDEIRNHLNPAADETNAL